MGVSLGLEIGLRVFSMPGWPTVCATLGGRVIVADGTAITSEPVVSIGY